MFARKRTQEAIDVALSSLIGAVVLNNTFGLSVLLGLISIRGLEWRFHAEVVAIVSVQAVVSLYAIFKRRQTIIDGAVIVALYPLSLFICSIIN
jgi:Ca2+/Na+ antiporter